MTDESLRNFIARRKRELAHQLAAVEGHIKELNAFRAKLGVEFAELESVEKTLPQLASAEFKGTVTFSATPAVGEPTQYALSLSQRVAQMTIKELVVQSLLDHYREGATLTEIRDFIRSAYGRVIPPSSLRPQMHRMKSDLVLVTDPATDKWDLMPEKRRAYTLFDHPSSRAAMPELRDDELSENDGPVLRRPFVVHDRPIRKKLVKPE